MLDRRRLLGLGGAAGLGLAAHGGHAMGRDDGPWDSEQDARTARQFGAAPQIRRRVTLGKTGLEVPEIGFGSASSSDPALVRQALARGVNFFDSAESYRWGSAEEAIGEALAGVPRHSYVLTSKTKAGAGETAAQMMAALDGSLKRLRTDYVDIYFNHAVNDVDRMRNSHWHDFTETARKQGKIRFRGLSGHGSRLAECLDYAIDNDLADIILAAYSFALDPDFQDRLRHTFHFVAIQPELPRVLAKAKEKEVGVIAMKTLMGARLNDVREYERDGRSFAQAALRWVLASPRVDAAVISMTSAENIDEYVGASERAALDGEYRAPQDLALLARYAYRQNARYCRPGCDGCAGACPAGVEIAEVLRTRMYAVDYGDEALARADHAALGDAGAQACLSCTHQACARSCVYDLDVPTLTRDTARRLGPVMG